MGPGGFRPSTLPGVRFSNLSLEQLFDQHDFTISHRFNHGLQVFNPFDRTRIIAKSLPIFLQMC